MLCQDSVKMRKQNKTQEDWLMGAPSPHKVTLQIEPPIPPLALA